MSDLALSEKLEQFLRRHWNGIKRVQGLQGGAGAYVLALAAISARRPMLIIAAGDGGRRARKAGSKYLSLKVSRFSLTWPSASMTLMNFPSTFFARV
jgi:hypothetical protein